MTNILLIIMSLFILSIAHNHAMIMKAVEENQKDRQQYIEEMKKISRRLK
jgi:hypothetical protein